MPFLALESNATGPSLVRQSHCRSSHLSTTVYFFMALEELCPSNLGRRAVKEGFLEDVSPWASQANSEAIASRHLIVEGTAT